MSTPRSAHRIYSFGEFTLDVDRAMLLHAEEELRLRPKSFAVLSYLIEHAGRLVSKTELLNVIWGHTAVTEDTLTQCLVDIRKALGDTSQRMIRTVPRRGYVFDAALTTHDDAAEAPRKYPTRPRPLPAPVYLVVLVVAAGAAVTWWWPRDANETSVPPISSVAVLPLTGIGLPADSEWLTLGIASELTSMLATIPTLRVASQADAFAHSGLSAAAAGLAMGVDGLLLGSLHAAADGLEVRMELVRTSDGEVQWRETFHGSMDDTLALQRSLAGRIFGYFGETTSDYGSMRPATAAAHVANLKRLAQWLTGNTAEERKWAEVTVALEPSFAMGYVNLVWPYLYAALDDPNGPWKSKIREALDTAERFGIAHSVPFKAHEGLYQWVFERNLDRAEELLREAFAAGDTYGRLYYLRLVASSGIHDAPLSLLRRLTVSEPQVGLHWELLAHHLAHSGDYAAAVAALEHALTLTGEKNFMVIEKLVLAHLAAGNMSGAHSAMDRLHRTPVPDWRLKHLEAWFKLRVEPGVRHPVEVATSLSAYQPSWPWVLILLSSDDPGAEQMLAEGLAAALESPGWGKYWVDDIEWAISPAPRNSSNWSTFRHGLGYTDEWRLDLCRRLGTLPPELLLSCDPRQYEVDLP